MQPKIPSKPTEDMKTPGNVSNGVWIMPRGVEISDAVLFVCNLGKISVQLSTN